MTAPASSISDSLYKSIFELSAVSMWVEDISELRKLLARWSSEGVGDLRSFLEGNRTAVAEAIHSIRVSDVNEATLALYEVEAKEDLLGPLDRTIDLDDPSASAGVINDIIAIAEERKYVELSSAAVTPSGKRLDLDIKIHIAAEGELRDFMLVSVADMTEKRRLERALEEERILYRTLVAAIPDGVYLIDRSYRYVVANDRFARLIDAENAEGVIGKRIGDFFPEKFARRATESNRRILETGEPIVNEPMSHPSGTKNEHVLATRVALRGPSGEITGVIGVLRDVTPLKNAEDALRASEERYRAVYDNAPIGIFHSSPDGGLLDANLRFARAMGYQTSEELVVALSGGSIQRLYHHPEERSSIIEATLENPEWRSYDWEFVRRDGSVGYGRMMLRSYLPAGASRKVIEGFMEDLTEQRAAERELSRERRLLRMLMEIVPDRIYFKDRAGHYLLANNAFAAAGGFASARALIGIVDSDLYDSVYAKEVRSEQMNILESGVPVLNKERQERWRGGASRWVAVTELPFRDEEEEISGTVGISRDITRQREMQQSITKAQRLESIALFATGVAHHFNNINFVIQGYLQMAISNSEVPDEVRGRLSTALEAVERAVDISRKMELLAHDPSTIREPVDLAELISGIVDVFLRRNQDAAIVLRREIASVPRVAADRSAVEFVVTSLLSNALHATLDAPLREVTIRTLSAPERSGFEVSDNGCGISSEELPKVFTPFYTTKGEWARVTTGLSKVRGMGLSLAVSRSALYAYNGIIELDSRLGEGATATVWLPLFDPSEGPPRNE